jgi:hypothetical protein
MLILRIVSVDFPVAEEYVALTVRGVSEAWQEDMLNELQTTTTISANTAVPLPGTIYGVVVADRKVLVDNGAKPDTLIVSTATYAALLESDQFVRATQLGDTVVTEGFVGRMAGLNVYEYQGFGALEDYVMYDSDALSCVMSVEMLRIKDSERFNGVLVQNETVAGIELTNVERALKKDHV